MSLFVSSSSHTFIQHDGSTSEWLAGWLAVCIPNIPMVLMMPLLVVVAMVHIWLICIMKPSSDEFEENPGKTKRFWFVCWNQGFHSLKCWSVCSCWSYSGPPLWHCMCVSCFVFTFKSIHYLWVWFHRWIFVFGLFRINSLYFAFLAFDSFRRHEKYSQQDVCCYWNLGKTL